MDKIKYDGKTIGTLEEKDDKVIFTKKVDPLKHKMHAFQAYGIQEEAFREHLKGEDGKVVIKEKDSKSGEERTLEAPISKWQNYGFVRDYGAGEQRFLLIDKMKEQGDKVNGKLL